ncbi:hypothetical protein ETAA8_70640 [Anatilimnocola aggregata]|uniref:Gamma-butyrobetaine hydroxylase-like N-terminal domain-containing protein n=1 Tax=Anatilimnocola aggregata TaxID=2528021 RepID=A0A517YNV0_9BACT|nr:DUF971 domain-containing protein [Anatilimnocola aggregata]QDU31902.1 hypothetical protein ETAA8_70640 [Anatilimnocola aggregata]
MSPQPAGLSLPSPDRLQIDWSDGMRRQYPIKQLREACPCATCREKHSQPAKPADLRSLKILTNEELQPLRIVKMQPLGNYAYNIAFSDGHDTGIFTLELLRELGEQVAS